MTVGKNLKFKDKDMENNEIKLILDGVENVVASKNKSISNEEAYEFVLNSLGSSSNTLTKTKLIAIKNIITSKKHRSSTSLLDDEYYTEVSIWTRFVNAIMMLVNRYASGYPVVQNILLDVAVLAIDPELGITNGEIITAITEMSNSIGNDIDDTKIGLIVKVLDGAF
jgi:hypothetical protein